ncbi:MAG: hypothetical protein M1831_003601 [Alyxoria varia]|nr:MAG: hypothetical protein M1831_003601 [Alyxoria varia]
MVNAIVTWTNSLNRVGEEVVLHGYLGSRSDVTKKLSFVPLLSKDLRHSLQLISNIGSDIESSPDVHSLLKSCREHTPVAVRGRVKQKVKPKDPPREAPFKRIEDVEVKVEQLSALNDFPPDIILQAETNVPAEQRHLQIRQSKGIRDSLAFRAKVATVCRQCLADAGMDFVEIETPFLFKSTPEGAREFLVPTRQHGRAYALPQSPQQFKQILMASAIPRYYQIVKCFRDEDLRADRQPEFTQLDLEMSFAIGKDVRKTIEHLLQELWYQLLGIKIESDFPRLTYDQAMSTYGSDKPDVRLGMDIKRIEYMIPADLVSKIGPLTEPAVEAFSFPVSEDAAESRKFVSQFMDSTEATPFLNNPDGQPGIFIFDPRKPLTGLQALGFEAAEVIEDLFNLEEGNVVVIQARKNAPFTGGSTALGNLRLAMHKAAVSAGYIKKPQGWDFLWVDRFPLFSPETVEEPGQGGSSGLASTHHPFTAPASADDARFLVSDPTKAKADHYDLVLNGIELGGGSRRIHDARMQEYVFRQVLKMTDERIKDFEHLLEVLRAGCPPHAGIALGFDRLCATMLGKESIRDVIAFPKTGKGEDLLVKSPSDFTASQLETYHLKLRE